MGMEKAGSSNDPLARLDAIAIDALGGAKTTKKSESLTSEAQASVPADAEPDVLAEVSPETGGEGSVMNPEEPQVLEAVGEKETVVESGEPKQVEKSPADLKAEQAAAERFANADAFRIAEEMKKGFNDFWLGISGLEHSLRDIKGSGAPTEMADLVARTEKMVALRFQPMELHDLWRDTYDKLSEKSLKKEVEASHGKEGATSELAIKWNQIIHRELGSSMIGEYQAETAVKEIKMKLKEAGAILGKQAEALVGKLNKEFKDIDEEFDQKVAEAESAETATIAILEAQKGMFNKKKIEAQIEARRQETKETNQAFRVDAIERKNKIKEVRWLWQEGNWESRLKEVYK